MRPGTLVAVLIEQQIKATSRDFLPPSTTAAAAAPIAVDHIEKPKRLLCYNFITGRQLKAINLVT